MKPSVRTKLRLIIGSSTLALVLMLGISLTFLAAQLSNLTNVERRLMPRLELAPKLETELEHLRERMQDAVAAEDATTLDESLLVRNKMIDLLAQSDGVLEPSKANAIRWAVEEYYELARNVSERLIAGETGEGILSDIQRMQASYERTASLIERTARVKPDEISAAFEQIRRLTVRANAYRTVIGLLGVAGVVFLSLWASRGLLRGLGNLSKGLARFSTGDFHEPVAVEQEDELGRVAIDANRMADSLRLLAEQRDREDRIKSHQAGLSQALWGELHLSTTCERALSFLVSAVDARAGALYLAGDDGVLRLEKQVGLAVESTPASFRPGDGLLGRAAMADDLVVVNDVPEDFVKLRSGLGAGAPRELLFLPLSQVGKPVGVLELAFFSPSSDEVRELLRVVRRIMVMAIEAARSRERLQALLEESQTLAETLSVQEEELKRNNEELTAQQEELRVANEELGSQREELHRRNQELEATRARVQQKADELAKVSAYKSQFLANMSHELRTPLNSMLLLSQLLSENEGGNLTEKQVQHMKTIHSAGEDLLGLINEVLDLARIEAGRQEVHFEQVELTRFVDFTERVFEPMATQKGLALRTEVAAGLPASITTDVQRVERILTNLVGNAIKFTDQGEVKLSLNAAPAELLVPASTGVIAFSVSDTGVGIPLEAQERIFSPFEQLEAHSNRRYAGSGLGLAIARESAQLLGGDLRVESVPGKGSTFTCYLPLRPPGIAELEPRSLSPQRVPEDDRATLSADELYLLVIEDDPVLAEQLVAIIHARGMKALVTSSGTEGLTIARERKPVGIVLDVHLHDLDGWTVMERLRADPVTRSIPVHFVSGVDSRERGLGLGAVGYLTKPVTHSELAGAVRALMLTPGGSAGKILVVEDDPDQRESLVELLESQDFEVRHADSARAAIAAVRADTFGCMILDLGLPDIDGLGLLREMRDDSQIHSPRVLVHTGRMLSKEEARELEAYAEAVILKDERSLDRLLDEVRLFVHHVNSAPAPAKRTSERPRSTPEASLRGMKILLAEDDMRTVYALSAVLRGRGATVLVADTGREALEVLTVHPDVDCVLMDIMMPEMDGYEAMRRLRKDPRFARLPVIALTARAMKGERERCLEAGASDYLAKPVDGEQLVSAVSSWFRARDAIVSGAPGLNPS